MGLGSQPPHHKDKLPNRSMIACWHGKARLGLDPHSLNAFGTGGAATWAGSSSPRPRAYPGQVERPKAPGECFPPLGATGASPTGCGVAAREDEGAQRAPHWNGLSVGRGGRGRLVADRPPRVTHNCTRVHGVVLENVLRLEGRAHPEVPWHVARGILIAV